MVLKVLPNNGNIKGMAIYPFILVKRKYKQDDVLINHERIHLRQQIELLILPFYLIYFIEYLFKGYRKISFEKEAYSNESDLNYLKSRECYANWRKRY